MRRVAAFLALEVDFGITVAAALVRRRSILGHEALDRRPGADERAVNAEVFGGEQLGVFGLLHHARKKSPDRVALNQPVTFVGIGAVIPCRVFHAQPQCEN